MENFYIKYLTLTIILLILFYIILLKKNSKPSVQEINNSNENFLLYMDKFFIKNLSITLLKIFLYFFINISMLLLSRTFFINNIEINQNLFSQKEGNYYEYISIIIKFLCIMIILILLKLLLDKLFFIDLIKLHIFLRTKKHYQNLLKYMTEYSFQDFFGKCYLFFYNITKGRTLRDLDSSTYTEIDQFDFIYENLFIQNLSEKCISFQNKIYLFRYLFILNKKIFRWLYENIRLDGFVPFIPKIVFIILIAKNITHLNLFYTIHIFYFYYISTVILDYFKFITNKSILFDSTLADYFYNKNFDYINKRFLIKKDLKSYYTYLTQHDDFKYLLLNIKNTSLVIYIINDFIDELSDETKAINRNLKSKYRRYCILILFIFIIHYFYENTFYVILLIPIKIKISLIYFIIIILLLLLSVSNNTYTYNKKNEPDNLSFVNYTHYKKFNRLFWFLTIIILILLYICIIKSKLVTNDILFDTRTIKLIKYYTLEEKTAIFHAKFDLYLKHYNIPEYYLNNIQILLQELRIEYFIFEDTSIADLDLILKDFFKYYITGVNNYIPKITIIMTHIKNLVIYYILTAFARNLDRYPLIWYLMDTILQYIPESIINLIPKIFRIRY